MRTPHMCCRRGKRVRIVLRGDEVIIGKFKDRTANFVILEDGRRIAPHDIRSFGLYREK